MELHALLTHRENVAWQIGEVCTWHFGLVSVALRSMPKIVADHPVHRDACVGHFPWTCWSCGGHAAVILNAVAAIEPANDGILCVMSLAMRSCVAAMNVCHCVQCDLEWFRRRCDDDGSSRDDCCSLLANPAIWSRCHALEPRAAQLEHLMFERPLELLTIVLTPLIGPVKFFYCQWKRELSLRLV